MNENTKTRNTGSHMNDSQILFLKRCMDMSADEILKTFPDVFQGITRNNIHDHLKTWKRYPDDLTAEEHKMHYNDGKSGQTSKSKPADTSATEERLKRIEAKLDWLIDQFR